MTPCGFDHLDPHGHFANALTMIPDFHDEGIKYKNGDQKKTKNSSRCSTKVKGTKPDGGYN
jgi:hypothetical protein